MKIKPSARFHVEPCAHVAGLLVSVDRRMDRDGWRVLHRTLREVARDRQRFVHLLVTTGAASVDIRAATQAAVDRACNPPMIRA